MINVKFSSEYFYLQVVITLKAEWVSGQHVLGRQNLAKFFGILSNLDVITSLGLLQLT